MSEVISIKVSTAVSRAEFLPLIIAENISSTSIPHLAIHCCSLSRRNSAESCRGSVPNAEGSLNLPPCSLYCVMAMVIQLEVLGLYHKPKVVGRLEFRGGELGGCSMHLSFSSFQLHKSDRVLLTRKTW